MAITKTLVTLIREIVKAEVQKCSMGESEVMEGNLKCSEIYINDKIADGVDLLVCESTYSNKLLKKAKKYLHMTAKEAALIASESNVKRLVLTHFSNRYKETHELEEEARIFFDRTICAKDLMKIDV